MADTTSSNVYFYFGPIKTKVDKPPVPIYDPWAEPDPFMGEKRTLDIDIYENVDFGLHSKFGVGKRNR